MSSSLKSGLTLRLLACAKEIRSNNHRAVMTIESRGDVDSFIRDETATHHGGKEKTVVSMSRSRCRGLRVRSSTEMTPEGLTQQLSPATQAWSSS